ncbi:MAG: DEAD/DEAH box helicase [Spirochaetaceae bacterium]|jgi:ATP-dependent RNA helicase RhlB|nr:DEAD/DEAH box helicase [Spirochaetaceae bacterium]
MEFQTLSLNEDLKKALAEAGYVSAMPVQAQVLESGLDGRDLYVQSQTGTGKTAAYLIIIMERLLNDPLLKGRKALIMVPTRELAVQVEEEAKMLGKYLPLKTGSFYGGVGYGEQQQSLRAGADILVGTPGRVLDLNASGEMNLMDIAFLILDEADRMFDMGFYPDLRKLIKVVPDVERRQTMLFSATLNVYVKNLALEYTKDPFEIEIEPEHITVEEIAQRLYHVPSDKKFSLLLGIFAHEKPESAIIFCNTKRYTEVVARRLRANGIRCEFISGDLPQKKRLDIINDLKAGRYQYLVATDVAARGLDIEALALVVNYDLPVEPENYVHRIGRTARAGANGKAVSFASEQDVYELSDIEKYIGNSIPSLIAAPEDYAEDCEHDWNSRPRRDGRPRQERKPPEPRQQRNDEGSRRDDEGRRQGRYRNPQGGAQPESYARAHPNLSQLSMDERMEYYKQKYGSESAPERESRGVRHEGARQDDARRDGARPDGARREGAGADGAGGGGKNRHRNRNRSQRRREGGEERAVQQGKAPVAAGRGGAKKRPAQTSGKPATGEPAKKGVFARLASLFGKKST